MSDRDWPILRMRCTRCKCRICPEEGDYSQLCERCADADFEEMTQGEQE